MHISPSWAGHWSSREKTLSWIWIKEMQTLNRMQWRTRSVGRLLLETMNSDKWKIEDGIWGRGSRYGQGMVVLHGRPVGVVVKISINSFSTLLRWITMRVCTTFQWFVVHCITHQHKLQSERENVWERQCVRVCVRECETRLNLSWLFQEQPQGFWVWEFFWCWSIDG